MKKTLMEGFQRGEAWAFTEIYKRFLKPIQAYVGSKIGNESIAQELTQEIFLKVFRFSSSYQVNFAFTTWLWTIARNTVLDFRRRTGNEIVTPQESEICSDDFPEITPDAENMLQRKGLRKQIYRMTRALSPIQRRILWLRIVVQLPYQEVAGRLGLTVSAAKSLVHRAKRELQCEESLEGLVKIMN